jgi:hypothetical protein
MPSSLGLAALPAHQRNRQHVTIFGPHRNVFGRGPARCQHLSANEELGAG